MKRQDGATLSIERPRGPRGRRSLVDKFETRRIELAEAALSTLAELGYAKTSLREIAQKSEFTHAVLHYYFEDKTDLICCAIKYFNSKCVTRYDDVTANSVDQEELLNRFLEKLAETMTGEPQLHSLWYDLRAQALFEDGFRDVVEEIDRSLQDMIWRVILRLAELSGGDRMPTITSNIAYAAIDGLFQKHLLRHVSGDQDAVNCLLEEVRIFLIKLL